MSAIKEKPILFSAPMVRAILDGSKTQTRRIIKPQPFWIESSGRWSWQIPKSRQQKMCSTSLTTASREWHEYMLPEHHEYLADDRLWVRENVRAMELKSGADVVEYLADGQLITIDGSQDSIINWLDLLNYGRAKNAGLPNPNPGRTVPSIHMPRWASRIDLEITGVHVERLNDISTHDAVCEGISPAKQLECGGCSHDPVEEFSELWPINGEGSWDLNPWVWVIEFKCI